MKNIILNIFLILALATTMSANNNPNNTVKILEDKNVLVSLSNADQTNIFSTVSYNESEGNIEFVTKDDISFVQVFNASGELEFQLMVDSNQVKIGNSLFEQGDYKLGFLIEGKMDIQFADVTIK